MELSLGFGNREIVDAGFATSHEALRIELPEFVSVGAPPGLVVVVVLVLKADGDAVGGEGPKFLHESVVVFVAPFAGEELANLVATLEELVAVAPSGVFGVGE